MIRILLSLLLLTLPLQALQLQDDQGELKAPAKEFLELFGIDSQLPIESLVPLLQEKWLQANKERWEMKGRFEEKREAALPLLQKIGCIETVHAQGPHYTYALVLGAIGKTMKRRLDFLYEEWQRGVRFDQIVLLTGQRDLDPKRETYPAHLLSETDLFVHLYQEHPLKGIVPMVVIDSPKEELKNGSWRRPNTAGTIRDWLATNPKPGTCLAISTQPFVGYQEAVVKFLLSNQYPIEAIGPGTSNAYADASLDIDMNKTPYPLSIYLDNFAKWLLYEYLRGCL